MEYCPLQTQPETIFTPKPFMCYPRHPLRKLVVHESMAVAIKAVCRGGEHFAGTSEKNQLRLLVVRLQHDESAIPLGEIVDVVPEGSFSIRCFHVIRCFLIAGTGE